MRAMLVAMLLLLAISEAASAQDSKPIALGQAFGGLFNESSKKRDGIYFDRFEIIGRGGQTVTIEATSNEFDPVLKLFSADGSMLAADDNGGLGLNARIAIKLPVDGRYYIETSPAWSMRGGNYRFSVVDGETPAKLGAEKLTADLEYFDLCLRVTANNVWKSELYSGQLLPLLRLGRDKEALKVAEEAANIAKDAGDSYALAKAFFTIGTGFLYYEEHKSALPYFEQSLTIRREIKDRMGEADVLNGLANLYRLTEDYDKARDYYQKALIIVKELKNNVEVRFILFGLAETYRAQKQAEQALSYYEQTLAMGRVYDSRYGDGYVLLGMADSHRLLGDYEKAAPLYEQALQSGKESKDRLLEAVSTAGLADGYRYAGDCGKAIPRYEQTLAIRREMKDRRGEAYTLNGLAECAKSQEKHSVAVAYYEQMLAIFRENKDRRGELLALSGLGQTNRALQQPQQSAAAYEQALAAARDLKDRRGEYSALVGLSSAYRSLSQYERALPYLEQALILNSENSAYGSIEPVLTALATVSFAQNQFEKAVNYCERAGALKREAKDIDGEAGMLFLLALSREALGRSEEAAASFKKALSLFQEAKNVAGQYSVHHAAAASAIKQKDWSVAQQNWEAALKLIESNPGAQQPNALPGLAAPTEIFRSYVDALAVKQDFAAALAVAERARVNEYSLAILNYTKSAKSAEEAASLLTPVSPEQAQQIALRLTATVVEYMQTAKGLVVWAIKPEGTIQGHYQEIKSNRLDELISERRSMREPKHPRADKLREYIGEPQPSVPLSGAAEEPGELYRLLFPAPIAEALPTDDGSRLVIIAPGKLSSISIAELQDDQGRYMIDRFSLIMGHSLSAFAAAARKRQPEDPPRSGALVIGAPTAFTANGKTMPILDDAKEELKAASDPYKAKPLTGAAATKAALREQASGKQTAHLVVYGFADDQNPLASFLAFAAETNELGEVTVGGILTADELRSWNLNIDLLAVTAFQNGFGRGSGDGLTALTHSLSVAGCSSVLLTLWNTDAKVTAAFMKAFYERFKKNNDAVESFRQAVLKTREKYKDPSQWAAFSLIGSPQ